MSEYDDMSIDELIEYPVRTAATAGKIGRELGRRKLVRDTYLDISEAMAEAGELVVVDRDAEPVGYVCQGTIGWLKAGIGGEYHIFPTRFADDDEALMSAPSLSLAIEAGVKP